MKSQSRSNLENSQDRPYHPSVYKKMCKTNRLIEEGEDRSNFVKRGGLSFDVYNYLIKRGEQKNKEQKETGERTGILETDSMYESLSKDIKQKKNALVLLIDFKDKKHTVKPDYFKNFLFTTSKEGMRDYYLEASYGKLDLDGDISKWYTAENERMEYVDMELVNGYPKARELVKEAIFNANKDDNFENFSKYSKDGKIEILVVIYAGRGLDTKIMDNKPKIEYHIGPHFDYLEKPIELKDGTMVDSYVIVPELPKEDLGCICHEVGHALGLPDLSYGPIGSIIGSWCLMAAGNWNNDSRTPALPSAWCRMYMGWSEPELISLESKKYEIPAVTESNKIYQLLVKGSGGKEYYLVENRQKKGFDEYLPSSGLLIWHVDERVYKKHYPNSNPQHFFLTLEQSDGRNELEKDWTEFNKKALELLQSEGHKRPVKNIAGDSGDVYPGEMEKRTFDDESEPNSYSYMGEPSGIVIKSISDSKEIMSAIMNTAIDLKYLNEGYTTGYKDGYKDFMKEITY